MAGMPTLGELDAVRRPIGAARGLPSAAYVSPEWARVERDTVLARTWTAIGHAREVPAGHAVPTSLLGIPLVMVRDGDDTLRVFHNVCRHRGHRLVGEPCKLKGAIRCPYHAWTYGLDGRLRGTPHIGGPGVHEVPGFDRSAHPLHEVRTAEWLGLVLVDLSGAAPPFEQHVAPLLERWEDFTGAGELGRRLHPAPDGACLALEVAANWKLAVENYCESYHLPWVHPELNLYSRLEDHYPILGDGWGAGQGTRAFDFATRAGVALPRFPRWRADRERFAEYVALFPNVLLGLQVDHAYTIVLQPLAHDRTVEKLEIRYVGEGAAGPAHAAARATTLEGWRAIFVEDVGVVEAMQAGRASPAFDGGAFSPVMDGPTHHFHAWFAERALAGTEVPEHARDIRTGRRAGDRSTRAGAA